MNIPTFLGEFRKNEVRKFLKGLWLLGQSRNLSDQRLKLEMPLYFTQPSANNWLWRNIHLVTDDSVTYMQLVDCFLEEVPFVHEIQETLIQALNEKQKPNESASEYILRKLVRIGEEHGTISDNIIVDTLCANIADHVCDYIDLRGRPTDIPTMQKLVREFEKKRDSRIQIQVKEPYSSGCINSISTSSNGDFIAVVDQMKSEIFKIKEKLSQFVIYTDDHNHHQIRNTELSPSMPSDNHRPTRLYENEPGSKVKEIKRCYFCFSSNHIQRKCSLKKETERQLKDQDQQNFYPQKSEFVISKPDWGVPIT